MKILNRYPTQGGYMLVIKDDSNGIKKMIFATETEADEFIKEEEL